VKITFALYSDIQCDGHTLASRPLGGVETATIRLSDALAQAGHDVTLYTSHNDPDNNPESSVNYLSLSQLHLMEETDAFIAVRFWGDLISKPIPARFKCLWTGDSHDQASTLGLGDNRVWRNIDKILTVSDWHRDSMANATWIPKYKIDILNNGIHLPHFSGKEERNKFRLIYTPTPFRGLVHFSNIMPMLLDKHPEIELHIYSGFDVYKGQHGYNSKLEQEYDTLMFALGGKDNIYIHGNLVQKDLAREFMKSSIFAYPNHFEETCCISAMESQAAGCVTVTSNLGALPNTIMDAGLIIDGKPGHGKYNKQFVDAVSSLIKDESLWNKLSQNGLRRAEELFDYNKVAENFEQYLIGNIQ
jgi:glycosyltransferase involved in cell wall biosynthesis